MSWMWTVPDSAMTSFLLHFNAQVLVPNAPVAKVSRFHASGCFALLIVRTLAVSNRNWLDQ